MPTSFLALCWLLIRAYSAKASFFGLGKKLFLLTYVNTKILKFAVFHDLSFISSD